MSNSFQNGLKNKGICPTKDGGGRFPHHRIRRFSKTAALNRAIK
ncbi:hypothetical protein [Lederbergia citrisecunda]|nr:hypothetical protein [Lederbergia citrisecunda]